MDEFAQTRAPDDLFDDDFIPIAEPLVQEFVQPTPPKSQRGRHDRPRGRGRGRPNQQQQQLLQHHQKPPAQPPTSTPSDPPIPNTNEAIATVETSAEPETIPKPSTAVRGDRSATGGNAKPKLTEEELSARLAAAKLNNARREEAHRMAEADEASFQQREAQASQRRQEEGRARRFMDQERERNRLRKLVAQGGREWDEGKGNQPAEDPRRSQYQREAHGGAAGYQGYRGREVEPQPNACDDVKGGGYGGRSGRGRGGRGRGRGGRGRSGFENRAYGVEILQPPVPDAETDFPALPPAERPKIDTVPQASRPQSQQQPTVEVPSFQRPGGGGQSWADEVNSKAPSADW